MKVFYVPKHVFGEFFYNPATQEGVGISEDGILVVGMERDYNPRIHPNNRECDVPDDLFPKLVDAALRYSEAQTDLIRALRHFPRDETSLEPTLSRPRPSLAEDY